MEEGIESSGLTEEQAATDLLLRQLLGTAIADRYADFCRLTSGILPLTVSRPLAGHALRELDSLIRHVLAVPMDAVALDDLEQKQLRREARQTLRRMGYDDAAIQRAGDALKPRFSHKTQIQRIVERLGLAPDGDIARLWISLNDAFGHAHERSFHESLKVDDSFRAQYAQRFDTIVRQLLAQLQGRYAALMQRAKEIAEMQPAQGIKLFVSEIPGAVQLHGYFYDNLKSEDWLPWLSKAGLLAEPLPDPQVGSALRLWTWPVGRYLIRMAASTNLPTRQAVANAIRALKSSSHPDVHRFGMDVVDALPAAEAAELVDVVCNWLTPNHSPYTSAPHNIIATLSKAGLVEPALRIVRSLFQLFEWEGRLTAFFDVTMYEHYVNQAVAKLIVPDPTASLPVFCDLLREAFFIQRGSAGLDEDNTYHSVGSLALDQSAGQDIHGTLILAIVRIATAAVRTDPRSVVRIHAILQTYKGVIYRRIQMQILAAAPSEAPELAEAYLTDAALLDASWCRAEYAELAKAWFQSLASEKQKAIIDAVDAIPEEFFERWKFLFQQREQRPPTDEEERAYWALSKRDIVWEWREALPSERREELEATITEFGDPDAWRARFFTSEKSPLSRESIQTQSIDDTVTYLEKWLPDPGLQTNTISALANELREAAAGNPTSFSLNAEKFARLRPLFIRRMLEGILQPTANATKISWEPLLALTKTVLERSKFPLEKDNSPSGDDSDWSLTLKVIIDVFEVGLRRGINGIDFQHTSVVQSLVLELYNTVVRLPRPDADRLDIKHPYFSAQQTIHGASIELCMLLLFWLTQNSASTYGRLPREALLGMPDITSIFESALKDQTIFGRIARAILGRYLTWLFHYGESWLRQNITSLFPNDDKEVREIAWISHLQSDAGPIAPLLEELTPCYADHIIRLGDRSTPDRDAGDNRLSEYLMVLYLWEELPEDLLQQFWQFASAQLRRHAMWFMGRELAKQNGEKKNRAILYWDRRLQMAIAAKDPEPFRKELGTIGQWFLWEMDESWLMDQLLLMLNNGFAPGDGLGIVDKLAEHVPDEIDRVVEITKALVKSSELNNWILVSQATSLRKILTEGKNSGLLVTRANVQETISYLSSRGNTSFLDLA